MSGKILRPPTSCIEALPSQPGVTARKTDATSTTCLKWRAMARQVETVVDRLRNAAIPQRFARATARRSSEAWRSLLAELPPLGRDQGKGALVPVALLYASAYGNTAANPADARPGGSRTGWAGRERQLRRSAPPEQAARNHAAAAMLCDRSPTLGAMPHPTFRPLGTLLPIADRGQACGVVRQLRLSASDSDLAGSENYATGGFRFALRTTGEVQPRRATLAAPGGNRTA